MDQKYLINKASFVGYEDVSVNIEETRLNVFIKKAQDLDLKPFFGSAFYYDVYSKLIFANGVLDEVNTPQIYIDLYKGREYTNRSGHKLYYEGMVAALIYWSFSRFVEADSVHYTATGPVTKQREDSDALRVSDVAKLVTQHRSVANAHANEIVSFLNCNRKLYPLWRFSEKNAISRQPGPRIREVDRTKNQNYGYNGNGFNWFL